MLAAFEKLGLDCASWNEPVYSDLLRCFYFLLYIILFTCLCMCSNGKGDGTLRFHEFMLINALNFIEVSVWILCSHVSQLR